MGHDFLSLTRIFPSPLPHPFLNFSPGEMEINKRRILSIVCNRNEKLLVVIRKRSNRADLNETPERTPSHPLYNMHPNEIVIKNRVVYRNAGNSNLILVLQLRGWSTRILGVLLLDLFDNRICEAATKRSSARYIGNILSESFLIIVFRKNTDKFGCIGTYQSYKC